MIDIVSTYYMFAVYIVFPLMPAAEMKLVFPSLYFDLSFLCDYCDG